MKKKAWRKGQGVINILPILIVEYYSYIKIVYVEFRFLKFFWYIDFSLKKRVKSN